MSKLEKLKEKARSLEGKDPKGAIETWLEILKGQEKDGDPNPDLAIFNRIGDLYLKIREPAQADLEIQDRKSTRLNSSHVEISYAVFCLKKKKSDRNLFTTL